MSLTRLDLIVVLIISLFCMGFFFICLSNIYSKIMHQNRKFYDSIRDFTDASDTRYNTLIRELTIIKINIEKLLNKPKT